MTNNLPQSVRDFLTDLKAQAPELGSDIEAVCELCYLAGNRDGVREVRQMIEADMLADALPSEYVKFADSLIKEWDAGKYN